MREAFTNACENLQEHFPDAGLATEVRIHWLRIEAYAWHSMTLRRHFSKPPRDIIDSFLRWEWSRYAIVNGPCAQSQSIHSLSWQLARVVSRPSRKY